jgi:hypothetical protein
MILSVTLTVTVYAFYAFYAWWFHFPQLGALAEGTVTVKVTVTVRKHLWAILSYLQLIDLQLSTCFLPAFGAQPAVANKRITVTVTVTVTGHLF